MTKYPSFGGAANFGKSDCYVDFMERPCAEAFYLLGAGAAEFCPDNNCGPRVLEDKQGREYLTPLTRNPGTGQLGYFPELWGHGGTGQTADKSKPLPAGEIQALRDTIAAFNTNDCKSFISELLTVAGSEGGDEPVYKDILDIFDAVVKQGGIVIGHFVDSKGASTTYSTIDGAVGSNNAKLFLSDVSNQYPSPELRAHYNASNAIAELTHVAGSKESGYIGGAFSDVNLAKVAHRVAKKHGKSYMPPPTIDPEVDVKTSLAYSGYYHDIVKAFCVPRLNPDTNGRPRKKPNSRRRY